MGDSSPAQQTIPHTKYVMHDNLNTFIRSTNILNTLHLDYCVGIVIPIYTVVNTRKPMKILSEKHMEKNKLETEEREDDFLLL